MNKLDIDKLINDSCVKYAATHSYPKVNAEWIDGINAVCDLCPTELETGKTKPVTETYDSIDENGQKVTVTSKKEVAVTTPFDAYCEFNKRKVREMLERAFVELPLPALSIPRRPNMQLWMKALACLFFNVKDVKAATKAAYRFVNALHDSSV